MNVYGLWISYPLNACVSISGNLLSISELLDYRNLVATFDEMLQEAGSYSGSPLVVFMDGLDAMEPANLPHNLDWLPESTPKVCVYVCSFDTGASF